MVLVYIVKQNRQLFSTLKEKIGVSGNLKVLNFNLSLKMIWLSQIMDLCGPVGSDLKKGLLKHHCFLSLFLLTSLYLPLLHSEPLFSKPLCPGKLPFSVLLTCMFTHSLIPPPLYIFPYLTYFSNFVFLLLAVFVQPRQYINIHMSSFL